MDIIGVHPSGSAFSQAAKVGPWLVVSGQVPTRDGALVGPDPLLQARQCFDNLGSVLAAAGLGYSDLVKLTCFLTDASAYPAYAEVKREVLGTAAPAGTAVIISGLLVPGALMEVEALAWNGQSG